MTLPEWEALKAAAQAETERTAEEAVKTATVPLLADIEGLRSKTANLAEAIRQREEALSVALREKDAARSWALAGWCAAGGSVVAGAVGIALALLLH